MWMYNLKNKVIIAVMLVFIHLPTMMCRTTNVDFKSSKQSIESNSIQRHTMEAGRLNTNSRSLKRVFISNRTITCNDGSQAGFYLRKSTVSKKWVVFLEGGWHCYDLTSCRSRWMRLRHLMTSTQWPEIRDIGGLLSPLATENPYWHDANHVFVPYCSSDSWSGSRSEVDGQSPWKFMGSLIIKQVIADLIPMGLGRSDDSELLLAGSSAGGLGVMLNLDRIKKFLHEEKGLNVMIRGISDSGWFLDREPFAPGAVAAAEAVREGWKLWQGSVPDSCTKNHPEEPWRCYFGHRLYNTLNSPLFVFQWLFDEAQMNADSVGAPVTPQQWNYIHDMGGALRQSLDNVSAVFAPSCIGHAVLTKRDWLNIKIDGISLPDALRCWEQATTVKDNRSRRMDKEARKLNKKRKRNENKGPGKKNRRKNKQDGQDPKNNNRNKRLRLTKEERQHRRRHGGHKRGNRNHIRSSPPTVQADEAQGATKIEQFTLYQENSLEMQSSFNETIPNRKIKKENQQKHKRKNRNRLNNGKKANTPDGVKPKRKRNQNRMMEPKKCSLRLLERCSWPQCNYSCPVLTNPLTGEEVRFLELLASFGLDIEAVATALGVDMQTLNNMDHTELVNLLTQQAN